MTSRVRCFQPPARPVPHSGQDSKTCFTWWVGNRPLAGRTLEPGLPGLFLPGWLLFSLRLDAGHSPGASGLGLSFQRLYPPLQLGDGRLLLGNNLLQLGNGVLLLGDYRQQVFPGSGIQVKASIHAYDLT